MSEPSHAPIVAMLAADGTIGTIALVFFLALFVGIVLWLVFSNSSRWKRDAEIPLHEDPVEPRTPEATDER